MNFIAGIEREKDLRTLPPRVVERGVEHSLLHGLVMRFDERRMIRGKHEQKHRAVILHRETCYLLARHGVGNAFIAGLVSFDLEGRNDVAEIFLEPILAPEYQL